MTRIEIETITEAMVTKQTWVRKELDNFLKVWADITQEKISGHERFVLYKYETNDGSEKRLILKRGIAEVDGDTFDPYTNSWDNWTDSYLDLGDQSIARIRKIMRHINDGITGYFKNIQVDIGNMDAEAQEIRNIIEKLT